MPTTSPMVKPLSTEQLPEFRQVCQDARAGFTDAVDLVLIHNERDVRGDQPRTTLNPLIVLLAAATWERFVADVRALACGQWSAVGLHEAKRGGAYLGHYDASTLSFRSGQAAVMLGSVSGGRLPSAWQVRTFRRWSGKTPTQPILITGDDLVSLAAEVDACIKLRNAVAHRCLPQNAVDPYFESDADAHTIQAGLARTVLAVFIQLTDQAIASISAEAGYTYPAQLRLPKEWFTAEAPAGLRGIEEPGALWGDHALHRP